MRITWNNAGERFYEVGVDRGVLFDDSGTGVPWDGLVSISENPSGGEAKDFYLDGIKYLTLAGTEEFGATIEAFTYPPEFSRCDGTAPIKNGLYASQQNRIPFGLCYRSKIGNDIDGMNHRYKLHLVYNALAQPSAKVRSTVGESVEASTFTWDVTTRPPPLSGYKATAHFEIDGRHTPVRLMRRIEQVLYGDTVTDPRMPSVDELVNMFKTYEEPLDEIPDVPLPPGSTVIDAGKPVAVYEITYDAGTPSDVVFTTTVDAGSLGD